MIGRISVASSIHPSNDFVHDARSSKSIVDARFKPRVGTTMATTREKLGSFISRCGQSAREIKGLKMKFKSKIRR